MRSPFPFAMPLVVTATRGLHSALIIWLAGRGRCPISDNWRTGLPDEAEATGDGSSIAILKRIRTLLGGTGSVRITDGTDTAQVLTPGAVGSLAVAVVDGSGVQITSFGGGTQYAVDAALGATPTGTLAVAIRDDALSALTPVEGDAIGLRVDANGALWTHDDSLDAALAGSELQVDIVSAPTLTVNAHAVTNAGTFATQVDGAALTALQLIDDPVIATGAAVPANAMFVAGTDGTLARALKTDTGGELQVDVLTVPTITVNSHAVTNAGTFAVQVDGSALTALQLIDDTVFADDVAFTPATSKVSAVGFLADETAPDSVDEGDIGIGRMTLDRFIRVLSQDQDTIRANGTSRAVTRTAIAAASSGNNTLVANTNGGLTVRVYAMTIIATSAVSIYFTADNAGTVIFGGSTNKIALAANGGFVLPYNPLGWFDTSANTDLCVNLSGATAISGGVITAEV